MKFLQPIYPSFSEIQYKANFVDGEKNAAIEALDIEYGSQIDISVPYLRTLLNSQRYSDKLDTKIQEFLAGAPANADLAAELRNEYRAVNNLDINQIRLLLDLVNEDLKTAFKLVC